MLPQLMQAVQRKWADGGYDSEPEYEHLEQALVDKNVKEANNDPASIAHNNVSDENVRELLNSEAVWNDILEALIEEDADWMGFPRKSAHNLKTLLAMREREQWDKELPAKLYRGQWEGKPEEDGFIDDVYVSSEPSVAASYGLEKHFDNREPLSDMPLNFADYVYEIITEGLDPEKFTIDQSGTPGEDLFGPQYKYMEPIKQEMVTITDSAGNMRTVPRIRKHHYLSDGLMKDVYYPTHLIDAVRRRY
jgi:hypothetical protein